MSELIQEPYDKFWDESPSRREMQRAFKKMGDNDANLFSAIDTQALVGNFICEKLGVTRAEIEAYVIKKAAEVNALEESKQEATENTLQGQVMDGVSS